MEEQLPQRLIVTLEPSRQESSAYAYIGRPGTEVEVVAEEVGYIAPEVETASDIVVYDPAFAVEQGGGVVDAEIIDEVAGAQARSAENRSDTLFYRDVGQVALLILAAHMTAKDNLGADKTSEHFMESAIKSDNITNSMTLLLAKMGGEYGQKARDDLGIASVNTDSVTEYQAESLFREVEEPIAAIALTHMIAEIKKRVAASGDPDQLTVPSDVIYDAELRESIESAVLADDSTLAADEEQAGELIDSVYSKLPDALFATHHEWQDRLN